MSTAPVTSGPLHRPTRRPRRGGFSLVELLVVIGIIALLIGLLFPAIKRAHEHAKWVNCQSNMRQVGVHLVIYAQVSKGWLYPVGPLNPATGVHDTLGANRPHAERWPVYVFERGQWNPPIMICPNDVQPAEEHTYVVNKHLADKKITYSSGNLGGLSYADVVVLGEKITAEPDYYMERSEFTRVVEPWRHGLRLGSNYLYLDMHVSTTPPGEAIHGIDPWDPPQLPPAEPQGAGQ